MAVNDITNVLKHPRPEVTFAHVRDDTIIALTQLAEIFKNKFQKLIRLSRPPRTKGLPL
jgi:hypothetical protein